MLKCPEHVKTELRTFMSKKKEIKEQRNLTVDIDATNFDIDDEDDDKLLVKQFR